jgi:hypothetical protein
MAVGFSQRKKCSKQALAENILAKAWPLISLPSAKADAKESILLMQNDEFNVDEVGGNMSLPKYL